MSNSNTTVDDVIHDVIGTLIDIQTCSRVDGIIAMVLLGCYVLLSMLVGWISSKRDAWTIWLMTPFFLMVSNELYARFLSPFLKEEYSQMIGQWSPLLIGPILVAVTTCFRKLAFLVAFLGTLVLSASGVMNIALVLALIGVAVGSMLLCLIRRVRSLAMLIAFSIIFSVIDIWMALALFAPEDTTTQAICGGYRRNKVVLCVPKCSTIANQFGQVSVGLLVGVLVSQAVLLVTGFILYQAITTKKKATSSSSSKAKKPEESELEIVMGRPQPWWDRSWMRVPTS